MSSIRVRSEYPVLRWLASACFCASAILATPAVALADEAKLDHARPDRAAYEWTQLAQGGGGYVTGLIAHPRERDLVYMRTDVGGAFRWSETDRRWTPLNDSFRDFSAYAVDGLALDPQRPDVVYVCVGLGKASRVLRSEDRGATWREIFNAPEGAFNGNGPRRWFGEPIAVDPADPKTIYVGTRNSGLLQTHDEGRSWAPADGVARGAAGIGVRSIAVHGTSVYAGAQGAGVFVSHDKGATWSAMDGSPPHPHRMTVDRDGRLLVTAREGAFRHDGQAWRRISPDARAYTGLSVAPDDPATIAIVVDQHSPGIAPTRLPILVTKDGGANWREVASHSRIEWRAPWYRDSYFSSATSSALFTPGRPGRLWLADWYSTLVTDDITAETVRWRQELRGHEEMVVLAMTAPSAGAPVLTGVADNTGFRHPTTDTYPERKFPFGQEVTGIDFSEANPDRLFQVGSSDWGKSGGFAAYSIDNGASWRKSSGWRFGASGRIAVSATNPDLAVALPLNSAPVRTQNLGADWSASIGAPTGALRSIWDRNAPLASDRVDGLRFYYLHPDGRFFASRDGGASWTLTSRIALGGDYAVKAAPGRAGDVWVAAGGKGLYRSSSSGAGFLRAPNVDRAKLIAFGKAAPGSPAPAAFLSGVVSGAAGVFRSDDFGANWIRIDDELNPIGAEQVVMEGDRRVFGRVYIGTAGRGVFVGSVKERRPARAD